MHNKKTKVKTKPKPKATILKPSNEDTSHEYWRSRLYRYIR